jgi:2-dehydro-3-deoxyphosphogluconate aldolase/(4S)-4-hydroxy-2-oxoglutarate aldolase
MSTLDPTPLFDGVRVIPVLTIERIATAVPLARALVAGGLKVVEVTLRTTAALDAVRAIAREVPEAIVGVGTVTALADIEPAINAGARYLVSPGTPSALADALTRASVPVVPGCATVTEAMALSARGFRVLKFFPAEACGGVRWLEAVAAPLPDLRFCPTGGINLSNVGTYLALNNVAAVGGSWMVPKDAIASGDFARVEKLARDAAAAGSQFATP